MAYKRRPGQKAPDMELVSEDRKEELRIEAQAKVAAERIAAAEREYAAIALEEERAKFDPQMEMTEVLIDLPAFATQLMIDFHLYPHGFVLPCTVAKAASIYEQMARMWAQEKQMGNPNARDYKPIRNFDVSAKSGMAMSAPVRPEFARI